MEKFYKLTCAFFCCLMLCACDKKPTAPNLVTKISVTDSTGLTHAYTEPQKMEVLLYYLRALEPSGKVKTDPERILGQSYRICVEFSDGQQTIYRQRANRFLSRDSHPWQNINSKKAAYLQPLLEAMPQG